MSESEDSDEEGSTASERTKDLMFEDAGANDASRAENNKVCTVAISLNNMVISAACTIDACTMDKTNYMLECSNCKGLTHNACTKLPAYQIGLFMLKGYRLYKCRTCVGEIHVDILENSTLEAKSVELTQLREKCRKLEEEKSSDMSKRNSSSSEDMLTHKVKYLEKELEISNNKLAKYKELVCEKNMKTISVQTNNTIFEDYAKLNKDHKTLNKILNDNKAILNKKTKEHAKIIGENQTLQQQFNISREKEENLRNLLEEREKTIDETQSKLNEIEQTHENHGTNVLNGKVLTKLINERFNKIEANIDQLITKKLAKNSKEVEQIEPKINEALDKNNSYADTLKSNLEVNNFAAVIKTIKNDDLIEKKERERRSANLIIYGIDEVSDDQNNVNEHDKKFVHSFLDIIGITTFPKQIVRLGKPNENKMRPVKLGMAKSGDKDTIMSRLGNLKNAEEIYRKVSVRDDYTIEER